MDWNLVVIFMSDIMLIPYIFTLHVHATYLAVVFLCNAMDALDSRMCSRLV